MKIKSKKNRDIEKSYSTRAIAGKLRRLLSAVEKNRRFVIQIAGERIRVPSEAVLSVEHEREGKSEEIEIQLKWENKKNAKGKK